MKKGNILAVLVAAGLAAPAWADSIGPAGTFGLGPGGGFGDFKTLPLADSDTTRLGISFHKNFVPPWAVDGKAFWAGVKFHLQVDPGEIDPASVIVKPQPGWTWIQTPTSSTLWNPLATQSGQSPPLSAPVFMGSVNVHVRNTTPANNSDIDMFFDSNVFNIYHVALSSTQIDLPPSFWVYVPPEAPASSWGEGEPPDIGAGTWVHLTDIHTAHNARSWFFGTSTNIVHQGGWGIEHVPAPGGIAMMVGGLGMMGLARRRRRS